MAGLPKVLWRGGAEPEGVAWRSGCPGAFTQESASQRNQDIINIRWSLKLWKMSS